MQNCSEYLMGSERTYQEQNLLEMVCGVIVCGMMLLGLVIFKYFELIASRCAKRQTANPTASGQPQNQRNAERRE